MQLPLSHQDDRRDKKMGLACIKSQQFLVPRDAWDSMVSQLGNLHQAGQDLAEARERAAKAETEATFLRDRLAEMRNENESLRSGAPIPISGDTAAAAGRRRRWFRRTT